MEALRDKEEVVVGLARMGEDMGLIMDGDEYLVWMVIYDEGSEIDACDSYSLLSVGSLDTNYESKEAYVYMIRECFKIVC